MFFNFIREVMKENRFEEYNRIITNHEKLSEDLSQLKRCELKRLQAREGNIKVSLVYINMIQETQNLLDYSVNLMKVSRKFQLD